MIVDTDRSASLAQPEIVAPAPHRVATASERAHRYRKIEARAVRWVAAHLGFFDPSAAPEGERAFAHKTVVELALLAACRARLDPAPLSGDERAIVDHVERVARWASYRDLVARDHKNLLLYGLTYGALRVCGRDDPAYRAVVERALAARYPTLHERVPFRQLDLIHFLSLAGFPYAGPPAEEVYRQTLLAGDPSIVDLDDADAYAITHALFYLTDFGLRAPAWPAGSSPAAAAELVEALLRRYRLRGNADLTGELVMSALCLGVRRSAEVDRAWAYLAVEQAADGRVPGPPGVIDEAAAERLGGPAYLDWKTSYHTTMVVAMAALMCRRAEAGNGYPALPPAPRPLVPVATFAAARRSALAAATGWLRDRAGSPDLAAAVTAGAGLGVALGASGSPGPTAEDARALAALAGRLDADPRGPELWAEHGADVLLEVAIACRRAGVSCERLDEDAQELAAALAPEALAASPDACGPAALLVEHGSLPAATLAEGARCMPPIQPRPASGERAAGFAARLLRQGGALPERLVRRAVRWRKIREWLALEVVEAGKSYRLDELAVIARALIVLGAGGDRETRDALDYLLSQQRADGSFGYFAQDDEDPATGSARLAWTVAAVLALAESLG